MCGICGVVGFSGLDATSARRRVGATIGRLRHRGPDGLSVRAGDSAVFGAARLLVRGRRGGDQPLQGPGGWLVVCNGEIDNHRSLRSLLEQRGHRVAGDSDVDVLPFLFAEFDRKAVEIVEGPFALAAWNSVERKLILARDLAGERPLFIRESKGEVWFASEIAALVGDPDLPCEIEPAAIPGFLSRGYFAAPATPIRGVSKVGPGETVEYSGTGFSRRRYRTWEPGAHTTPMPTIGEFAHAFRAAVARQADVDVPYGIFLSGGLDSSLVAAVALRSAAVPPKAAFCLRFHEDSYDEGPGARNVARRLGLTLTEVWVDALESERLLEDLVATGGEPLADPAWAPSAALAREAAKAVRMVLCGEGSDEVMGGYPTYLGIGLASAVTRLPRWMRSGLVAAASRLPDSERKVTVSYLLKRFMRSLDLDPISRHRAWTACVDDAVLSELGLADRRSGPAGESEVGILSRVQRIDFEGLLGDGLMTKSDRSAMRYGLEIRCPFLDSQVLALAAAIPERDRVAGLRGKVFLKRFAAAILPPAVVHARKRGLSVPVSSWLRTQLKEWAGDRLSDSLLWNAGIDPRRTMALFDAHVGRKADHGRSLWALAVLATWLRWFESRAGASAERSRVAVEGL